MLRFRWSAPEGSSPRQEKQLCFFFQYFPKTVVDANAISSQRSHPHTSPYQRDQYPVSPEEQKPAGYQTGYSQSSFSLLFTARHNHHKFHKNRTDSSISIRPVSFFCNVPPKGHEVSVCLQLFQSEQLPPPRIQPAKDLLSLVYSPF